MTLFVRPMTPDDVPACTAIVNDIIARGGTTAYEEPYREKDFEAHYLNDTATAFVVLDGNRLVGFQGCFEVEPGIYSIGSFTDRNNPVRGAGRALFDATLDAARKNGATTILAKITSDNAAGLGFYSKMGFEDFQTIKDDHQRPNGLKVDRIIKKFVI